MSKTINKVELVNYTRNPLQTIADAARICYASNEKKNGDNSKFVAKLFEMGHLSPLEHVSFTFEIQCSRACSHQLVRHRLASYSQRSQRYIDESGFDYIIPNSIKNDKLALRVFLDTMDVIKSAYGEIKKVIGKAEDARFVLPNACSTNLFTTMNVRELLHFFEERTCNRAQWEIRAIANDMLKICHDIIPEIFNIPGAKCDKLGYCPEGKMSCGRYDVKGKNV